MTITADNSTVIGQSMSRADGPSKVQGRSIYGVDYAEVGMLFGAVLRSPVPAGRIVKLDTGAAEALPGVHLVCSARDQPDTFAGWVLRDQRLFATDEVRYEGEPIAVVVADDLAAAHAGVRAIGLEIDEYDGVDLAAASGGEARSIHPGWESYQPSGGVDYPRDGKLASEMRADPEGVDEAFASAARIVEDRFGTTRQYQAYLEPKAALATYADGRYTIHASVQFPYNVRDRVAQLMGVRVSDVRVVGHTIGGGFGAKLDAALEPLAAFAAKLTGRPVKITNTRAEDLLTCPSRENAVVAMRTALDASGTMIAREVIVDMDNGAFSTEMPWLASLPLHIGAAVYNVEGPVRVISRLWYTNTAPTGAFRGVGGTYLYHALERHTDSIANAIGVDRRTFRTDRLIGDGARTRSGQVLEEAGILAEAYEELERIAPWKDVQAGLEPWQGVGLASGVWMTNPMPGQATVKITEDGTAQVITGATENGSGAVSMGVTQIVAAELGIGPDLVSVSMPDTDVQGYDAGSQGSRTTHIVGRAARDAAAQARAQLLSSAADMLEASVGDLEIVEGTISVVGTPTRSVSVSEAATAALWTTGQIAATSSYTTPPIPYDAACGSGVMFTAMATPTYHVHMAIVEVDPVTGCVRVVRYVVVQEVGRAINPAGIRGQIQGGVTQGIGLALYESLRIGDDCRYVERSLEAYRLPLAVDIPDVEFSLLEHPAAEGPFGARGVAEPPAVFVAAAIGNAVSHAVGRPMNQIPVTPEDVLDAIEDR